ncbi:purine nucleoside phosphorylase LACC1 isoform X2 [Antennarius striatus]|uniref:purine nucleoside phosphorylase LACC1 isoform X2 n=1 Tax=Antennarius striatus TaxID=241820 RepID=UPI0035B4E048
MCQAVLLDLVHGCCPRCAGLSLRGGSASDRRVFLLRAKTDPSGACASPYRGAHALDGDSTAERLYRMKRTLDDLDLSSVRVVTSARGREALLWYQRLLFTAVYRFEYRVTSTPGCPSCCGSAHTGPTPETIQEEVSAFVQRLPALMGDVKIRKSTMIPDVFGHGFSSRAGGVSYIPTLSSLNLFCSQTRRDPPAVVTENRRRLALHAGFPPQSLHLVKVAHASDIWVMGTEEPRSYDAVLTNQRGVVLAAPGADCMPILFADPVSEVIGAAHAGWKGTLKGVAMATVDAMVREFGCHVRDIMVAVGPSVGSCCFTLEQEHALDFSRIHPDCVPDPESPRPHVNIRLANRYHDTTQDDTTQDDTTQAPPPAGRGQP